MLGYRFPSVSPAISVPLLLALSVIALFGQPATSHAQNPEPPLSGSYDEKEAQKIDRMLMCPVCPAESIDQAQVELARQMRAQVRLLLAQGQSREDVLDYFVQRYGQQVLAAPPFAGISLVAWVVPIGSVLLGIAAGFVILRSMSRRQSGSIVGGDPEDLEPYLEAVDRGLSLDDAPRRTEGAHRGPMQDSPGSRGENG